MNYAKQTLIREFYLLEKAISEGNWELYPEALKDRKKKIKDLKTAIELINSAKNKAA